MTCTAATRVEAELDTVLHHIIFWADEVRILKADLASAQEKLHGYQADAVFLEDALKVPA